VTRVREPENELLIREVTTPLGNEWGHMTFPIYRFLLSLIGTGETGARGHRPLACVATSGGTPVGLALAQRAPAIPPTAEVLSLFVVPAFRGAGIATRLLACLEDALSRLGVSELSGTYMTGPPTLAALERVLAKRGFDPPMSRRLIIKFTPEQSRQCLWFQRARMPDGASIFKWAELTREELARLKQSQKERRWIHPKLEPWRWDRNFDPVSSVGMRKDGEVVGWVISHRMSPGVLAFTTAFMRTDLARRGASFPLYVATLESLMGSGVICLLMTDPNEFPSMARFVLRRCSPLAPFTGETRGVSKRLDA
jgi:GNAT superfamily N-acetyltransferase